MQAIEDKILNKMKKCGRGKLYSASDFAVYGSAVSVAKALERLTRKGGLVRIARGLYCYPKSTESSDWAYNIRPSMKSLKK